jgi:hypothetical protein
MGPGKLVEGEVFRSDQFVVTRESGGRLIRLKRTDVPLDEASTLEALRFFDRFLPHGMRPRYALLFDSRDAPMVEDREKERRVTEAGARLLQGFARSAILVQSAAGKLQASRMTRESGRAPVFADEGEAIGFLMSELPND